MPLCNTPQRAAALAILVMLPAGFAYSGVATIRLYRQLFVAPPAIGRSATVDANLALVDLSSGAQLRDAVAAARWPPNEDVVVVGEASKLSKAELTQFYYTASYLLYPRPVWLTPAPPQTRHALVVGPLNQLSLVDLR